MALCSVIHPRSVASWPTIKLTRPGWFTGSGFAKVTLGSRPSLYQRKLGESLYLPGRAIWLIKNNMYFSASSKRLKIQ
jgi:hypothetical protein